MARLVFWRLVRATLAVWALASVVFLVSHHHLNAALQLTLAGGAEQPLHQSASPAEQQAAQQALRQRLGLDVPLFYISRQDGAGVQSELQWNGPRNQYHRWLAGLVHGSLGTSFRTGEAVTVRLRQALVFTLPLTGMAAALAVLLAVLLAQRLAARPRWGPAVRVVLTTMHALPLFVVALLLLLLFANPDVLAWFPSYGLDQPADASGDVWNRWLTYSLHFVLPVTALALSAIPELTLQLDAALTHELHSDYATTARAKGLTEAAVIWRHALRSAVLPALVYLAELLPALVAGAVVVEVVFALPGMGRLLAQAAAARDYPVLVGGVLLLGAARLLALLLTDVLSFWADPRIRWQS